MKHPETSPVPSKKLYEQLADSIRIMIEQGELCPGDRLPAERKLAQTFQVSRNSVREAIKQLEERGILQSRIGAGTYVATDDKEILIKTLAGELEKGKKKLREIFEIREILEPQIAALATQRITPKDITKLEKLAAAQKEAQGDIITFSRLDTQFHTLLARATNNSILEQVFAKLRKILKESRSEPLMNASRQALSIRGHEAILEALRNRNATQASLAMQAHIADIRGTNNTQDPPPTF
jgi:GntR family transcriptional repressor for pyruvate dehydrogenase complex